MFTPEELEEIRRADAEIDAEPLTMEEIRESRERDREAKLDGVDGRRRRIAAKKKAYREANREHIAAYHKAYYEANREDIAARQKAYREANREDIVAYQKAYYEANREDIAAYQRAYRAKNRENVTVRRNALLLEAYMAYHGVSQTELSKRLCLSSKFVSNMVNCEVKIPERVFEALGIEPFREPPPLRGGEGRGVREWRRTIIDPPLNVSSSGG